MSTKRILGATSIRSDYDLMAGTYAALNRDADIDFKLLVSGTHLCARYGNTLDEIRKDRLPILAELDTLQAVEQTDSRVLSAARLIALAAKPIQEFAPDLILTPGDREDALSMAVLGAYLKIPVAHFFGGDHAADGNVDNPVRHAISKLASAHFVIHDEHVRRLRRMGEPAHRIHLVGNPALDRLRETPRMAWSEVQSRLGVSTQWSEGDCAIVIHHPILSSDVGAGDEVTSILAVLKEKGIRAFVGTPNSDTGSEAIFHAYEKFKTDSNFHFYSNLNRELFINLLRGAAFLIGNSSMGLIEAPSVPIGAINVGLRQRGRMAAKQVLFVDAEVKQLRNAIEHVRSATFREGLKDLLNPYGDGHSVARSVDAIKKLDLDAIRFKTEDPLAVTG